MSLSHRATIALVGAPAAAPKLPARDSAPDEATIAADEGGVVPAGGDAHQLRSRATSTCVSALGRPAAGTPLVQVACGAKALTWTLNRTADGFALTTGDLVVGLGRSRYGDGRLLVLQRPEAQRHRSWAAVPS